MPTKNIPKKSWEEIEKIKAEICKESVLVRDSVLLSLIIDEGIKQVKKNIKNLDVYSRHGKK